MWCIPPEKSAEFVYHMEGVLEVYHRPHDPKRPVVCLDETFRQPIGETREPLPSGPGRVERHDCVDVRNGTAGLSLAFEPLAGWRHAAATESRTRTDWARFVGGLLDDRYAGAEKVVLVMGQLDTRPPASLDEAFPPEEARRLADRLGIRHTPEHGSWPNMAEVELSALARGLPERVGDRLDLERHTAAWERDRNGAGGAADRRFTTADARIKRRKLYPTLHA